MTKKIIILLLICVLFLSSYLFYINSFCKFQPILFNGNEYENYEPKNKSEFNNKLQQVLRNYEEDFKISSEGDILIKRKLQSDTEIIHNYTTKSLDNNWHPYNSK